MKQISRHIRYITLILLGAIVHVGSTVLVTSLGIRHADDMISSLLSFLGVLAVSIIVSVVLFFANRLPGRTSLPGATVQLSIYNRAVESRYIVIQALRHKLSETEHELNLIKRSFAERESSLRSLETERDALEQSNDILETELEKEREKVNSSQILIKDLKRVRNSFSRSSDKASRKLAQEQQKLQSAQIHIEELEQERDRMKQAGDQANRELAQEREKVADLQQRIADVEQEMHDHLETISTDIMNGDTVVLLSPKAWKERGDGHETQKWKGLFSKIKNPLLRSQQERADGDGFVYPRGAEARRVRYLREEKRITVIKICEIYRKHAGNKQYNEGRTKGMEASKYNGVDFSYMLPENAN